MVSSICFQGLGGGFYILTAASFWCLGQNLESLCCQCRFFKTGVLLQQASRFSEQLTLYCTCKPFLSALASELVAEGLTLGYGISFSSTYQSNSCQYYDLNRIVQVYVFHHMCLDWVARPLSEGPQIVSIFGHLRFDRSCGCNFAGS